MRKLIKLAILAFGIRALLRRWKARNESSPAPTTATTAEDPADELRRKLAASRDDGEPTVEAPAPEAVGDRRTEVHEQGRATLDEMNSTTED
ncbi:MAG TPA: hypothetical protein VEW90_06700 [Gaiellaceae bacterium]|nr:hypothetical protein [Gaiellaceae bacterium]